MTADPTWVVGSGGLLGKAVTAALRTDGVEVMESSVPWSDPQRAMEALDEAALELKRISDGGPWSVIWCAGAGVTGTSQADLDSELLVFRHALDALKDVLGAPTSPEGKFFLASSAGGVYAGSPHPPFTEFSPVAPLAPYGRAKLEAESAVRAFAATTGVRALIGRVSNLYGPGQNLAKAQGLISVFAKAYLTAQPVSVYVSLDTLRDYLYVDDAARLVVTGMRRLAQPDVQPGDCVTKILASQRSDTIGSLIGACRTIFKRSPRVVLGASPFAKAQASDLRMQSVIWPELDQHPVTPLAVGLDSTVRDIQALLNSGRLTGR